MAKMINRREFHDRVLNREGVVLVDFSAVWCGPCKMMSPILDQLSNEMGGRVRIFKVDVDRDGELANQYKVMSVPTMIIFKDGQPVDSMVGFVPKAALKAKLEYFSNSRR